MSSNKCNTVYYSQQIFFERREGMEPIEKVKMAKKGDDNAFYELIQDRKEMLYKTAYTYVRNKEDALDIVQETVYKAYCSIKKLKEPAFFNTWLTRILINCSLDYMKKKKIMVPMEEKIESSLTGISDRDREQIIDLRSAVDRLDDKCKTVVILKYFQDMTIEQISDILECPSGTIKSYLHKALIELRLDMKEGELA